MSINIAEKFDQFERELQWGSPQTPGVFEDDYRRMISKHPTLLHPQGEILILGCPTQQSLNEWEQLLLGVNPNSSLLVVDKEGEAIKRLSSSDRANIVNGDIIDDLKQSVGDRRIVAAFSNLLLGTGLTRFPFEKQTIQKTLKQIYEVLTPPGTLFLIENQGIWNQFIPKQDTPTPSGYDTTQPYDSQTILAFTQQLELTGFRSIEAYNTISITRREYNNRHNITTPSEDQFYDYMRARPQSMFWGLKYLYNVTMGNVIAAHATKN